jgi:outer membrane immunogenic protein
MKKLLVAGIAAGALCSAPALAGPPPSLFNWSGCYMGANAGYLWGVADPQANAVTTFAQTSPRGFTGGGQVGCNYQVSNWLVGLQGDFNDSRARNSQTISSPISFDTFETRVDWLASATARIGYARDQWLVYGKGGAAWVRDTFHDNGAIFIFSLDFSGSETRSGWTVGGGVEYGLTPNWSIGLEYDYYNFGTKFVTLPGIGVIGATTETFPLKENFSVVKAVINYRFSTGH